MSRKIAARLLALAVTGSAWPSKVEIGSLKAGSSEVLMETVTMTCEFIQRVSV